MMDTEDPSHSGVDRIKDQMKVARLPELQYKTDGMFTVILERPAKCSLVTWRVLIEQILLLSHPKKS